MPRGNYTQDQRLSIVMTVEQKEWLKTKAAGMKSMADVLRDLIDAAMAAEIAN